MTRLAQYIKQYGFIKTCLLAADRVCYRMLVAFRKMFYRWSGDKVGFAEALFWSKDLDPYLRYSRVLGELKDLPIQNGRKLKVIEVGAGSEGIARFLKYAGQLENFDVYLADTDAKSLSKVKLARTFILDSETLPFEDGEFDVVISLDTLEHIPKAKRKKFLEELKRVSRRMVILHFVMHDPQKNYFGRDGDLRFNQWHLDYYNKPSAWTEEHLAIEPPEYREIEAAFDNPAITGTQNLDIWFNYITMQSKPLVGFLTGFRYKKRWQAKASLPPFHGCFVKWTKK